MSPFDRANTTSNSPSIEAMRAATHPRQEVQLAEGPRDAPSLETVAHLNEKSHLKKLAVGE